MRDARLALEAIPGVRNYEQLRQISRKSSDFRFALSMEFDDQKAYDAYDKHPRHVDFVQSRWNREVEKFMELDYEAL